MKSFKEFNIAPVLTSFTGDKIKIDKILNTEITVHAFKIEDSTVKLGTKRLTLQIEKTGTMHVLFSGSTILQQMILAVAAADFPFTTTIKKESEHLEFT